ncbi:YcxB family protein [Reichenbachiella sp. MALMAid0571]|uniref:YcxB family protein n=1 Tax=Reichenbachiella sp. MALMAid0571 TaxID=3143939 RepID=UPI0032DE3887
MKFNIDVDDWMEFHKYHLLTNKQFQKTKLMMTLVVPVVFGVFMYYKFQSGELIMQNALMVVLMSALWVLFYPKRLIAKALGRAKSSVENSEDLGMNEIDISAEKISHKHPKAETTYDWSSIKNAAETETSMFLFSSPANPIIIPKEKVDTMEWTELRKMLVQKNMLESI